MANFKDFMDLFNAGTKDKSKAREQKLYQARANQRKAERLNTREKNRTAKQRVAYHTAKSLYRSGLINRETLNRAKERWLRQEARGVRYDRMESRAQQQRKQAQKEFNQGHTIYGKAADKLNTWSELLGGGGGGGGGSGTRPGASSGGGGGGGGGKAVEIANLAQLLGRAAAGDPVAIAQLAYKAIVESIQALQKWTTNLQNSNFEFAKFSAAMANVAGRQQIRELQLGIKRGDRRASSADYLSRNAHELNKTTAEYADAFKISMNYVGGYLSKGADSTLKGLGIGPSAAIQGAGQLFGFNTDWNPTFHNMARWFNNAVGGKSTKNPEEGTMAGDMGRLGEQLTQQTWDREINRDRQELDWDRTYGRPMRFHGSN